MAKIISLSYESCGNRYSGIYARGFARPQKGIVLYHGHPEKVGGRHLGVRRYLEELVSEIPDRHPSWVAAAIDRRGYGESCPDQPFHWVDEIIQKAASDGVKKIMEECELQPEQIFLWGQSEGGQIAMLLAAKYLPNVAGVISYSGVLDFARFIESTRNSSEIKRKLEEKGIHPEDYPLRSPLAYVKQIKCPVLVWYSHEDNIVTPDIPIRFAEVLKGTNSKVIILPFEGGHAPLNYDNPIGKYVYPYGYQYDWMWKDYFAPFIDAPESFIATRKRI